MYNKCYEESVDYGQVNTQAQRSFLGRLADDAMALYDAVLRWQERAEQRHRLGEMPEYLLRDMGISRADVDYETSKPFWREVFEDPDTELHLLFDPEHNLEQRILQEQFLP